MLDKDKPMGPIILDIGGWQLTEEDKKLIAHPSVGGVIFFSRNYDTAEQLMDLVRAIRAIRPHLLLCVDQEGGRVQRFLKGLTRLPCARTLRDSSSENSYRLGYLMALEVRALGVDLSFAPVLDLDRGVSDVIGDRAFHSDPKKVIALANAYMQGMSAAGMQAVGKHFPGHGAVVIDSHHGLPIDTRSLEAIEEDLLPFKHLIQQGMPGVMPAHIVYPQIDEHPVGFSRYWLQTVLRKSAGFQGTIVSDDLSMAGAAVMGNYYERARTALEAGCDFILMCNCREQLKGVVDKLQGLDSTTSVDNRVRLLGKGEAPNWLQIKQMREWQECSALALELAAKNEYSFGG